MPAGGAAFAWGGFSAVDARRLAGGGYVVSALASNAHRKDALSLGYNTCAVVMRLDVAGERDWHFEHRCESDGSSPRLLLATDREQRTFVLWHGAPELHNPQMRAGSQELARATGPLAGHWPRLMAISPAGFPMWQSHFIELGETGASARPLYVDAIDGGGAIAFLSTPEGLAVVGTWGDGRTRFVERYPGTSVLGDSGLSGDSDERRVCLLGPSEALPVEKNVGGSASLVACFDKSDGHLLHATRVERTRILGEEPGKDDLRATALAMVGDKLVIAGLESDKMVLRMVGADNNLAVFPSGEVTSMTAEDERHVLVPLTLSADVTATIAGQAFSTSNTWPSTDLQIVLRVDLEGDHKVEVLGSMLAQNFTNRRDEPGGSVNVARVLREADGSLTVIGTLRGALRVGSQQLGGLYGVEDACNQDSPPGKNECGPRFWGEPSLFGARWRAPLLYE